MTTHMPELLSPAGNMEKLKAALRYGADAVYLAADHFGMRAGADNFTLDELPKACEETHKHGKKLYLTLNTMPREDEYAQLRLYMQHLRTLPMDAYLVADPGVLMLLKEIIPDAVIHISTQANTVSSAAARAWGQTCGSGTRTDAFGNIRDSKKYSRHTGIGMFCAWLHVYFL